tara:strand:- start:2305 stop:4023 length:1719 start_codon:yes stop_codon:yes gene_type:complete
MESLPFEIQLNILNRLSIQDLKNVYLVDKSLNTLCKDVYPSFQILYTLFTKKSKIKNIYKNLSLASRFFLLYTNLSLVTKLYKSIYFDKSDNASLAFLNRDKKEYYKLIMKDQKKLLNTNSITNEQKEIVDITKNCEINSVIAVQAYAGTGKTTTLKYCCESWTDKNILCFAFNKSATNLLSNLFCDCENVTVKGFHSLAFQEFKDIKICDKLKNEVIRSICPEIDNTDDLNLLKKGFERFCYSSNEQSDNPFINRIFKAMNDETIPFTHDAYLKKFQLLKKNLNYDVVFVDEAQDCNDCMASIVMNQTNSLRVFVGDIYQNIYSFRNLEHNKIMKNLYFESDSCIKKYLSVSFRYGGTFGLRVNEFLKRQMKTKKTLTAIGKCDTILNQYDYYSNLPKDTAIICRHNKTIFAIMFEISRQNIKYKIIRNKTIDFDEEILINKDLYHLYRHQLDQITHPKIKKFEDIYQLCIHFKSNNKWTQRCDIMMRYPEDCWQKAKEMYDETNCDIIISNTHQVKGMEFDNVAVASDFDFSSEESKNIFYTAVTRVKKKLFVMNDMYEKEFVKSHLFSF